MWRTAGAAGGVERDRSDCGSLSRWPLVLFKLWRDAAMRGVTGCASTTWATSLGHPGRLHRRWRRSEGGVGAHGCATGIESPARRCLTRPFLGAGAEREVKGGAQVRQRLGPSRTGLEQAPYSHVDRSRHLRHHVTKAVAMHAADQAWRAVSSHLFPDRSAAIPPSASGGRLGVRTISRPAGLGIESSHSL